jgi:hypothetical protein
MPVSATLASQEFTQDFPKPRSPCDVFSADEGSSEELLGILTGESSLPLSVARQVSRFTGDIQWSSGKGACSQAVVASMSELWDGLRQRGLLVFGRRARFGFRL